MKNDSFTFYVTHQGDNLVKITIDHYPPISQDPKRFKCISDTKWLMIVDGTLDLPSDHYKNEKDVENFLLDLKKDVESGLGVCFDGYVASDVTIKGTCMTYYLFPPGNKKDQ